MSHPISFLLSSARGKRAAGQDKNHWILLVKGRWEDVSRAFNRPRARLIRSLLEMLKHSKCQSPRPSRK